MDELADVTHQARLLLEQVGVLTPPTPVEELVLCMDLLVAEHLPLSEEHADYFTELRHVPAIKSALRKVMGLLDRRQGLVHLNTSMSRTKRNFVLLHEVGHQALPWQRELAAHYDDDSTLGPDVKAMFEREANLFAAETMFQLDRFEQEASDLPLGLRSALALAQRYQASAHATLRRYTERHISPCLLIVLENVPTVFSDGSRYQVARIHESSSFAAEFPTWPRPRALPATHGMFAHIDGANLLDRGGVEFTLVEEGQAHDTIAQLFKNSHHIFAFIFPKHVRRRARRSTLRRRTAR